MKTFDLKTPYGIYKDCELDVNRYSYDNSLALGLFSRTEGPIARLTVCIDYDRPLTDTESFVDTNNNPWAEDFIRENKLGESTGEMGRSGWCVYPLYKFNMEMLEN